MLIEPRDPKYTWGARVVALVDLHNDGTFPERAEGELLVPLGGWGEIVNVGHHNESNTPIYLVDFDGIVLGCTEEEILLEAEVRELVEEAGGSLS
jgi:nitrogen fixation protein NifZ